MKGNSRGVRPAHGESIIFVNRYFYPDHSATSQILSDLAFHLAASGRSVRVLTSRQRYDDPSAELPEVEARNGVLITRLATTRFGRSRLVGRAFDYLSFYQAARRSVLAYANPGDVVVAKTDPPLLGAAILGATRRRGVRLVNWLQDIYPEVAVELGVPLVKGPIAQSLMRARDMSLRSAEANIVVGEGMAEVLLARGVRQERIHVICNWCDDEEIRPVPGNENPLRREWLLEDRFVVGYSGNLGRGHEFDTALSAAECLRGDPRIVFLFIGGGHKLDELKRHVSERNLGHLFRFMQYQDTDALKHSLAVPDVHWFSLKPELEGLMVPSKFYGIAAAGRAMIAVTSEDGELARLIRLHRCGEVIAPGNAEQFAAALRRFSVHGEELQRMGLRARRMLEAHFSRNQALRRWQLLFEALSS
ncbi:MAG TPA: glycosyltransferase family 4 protein [Stellaceae bacterium]|nr:glycosyltransferase family 4 protein [Stellaceae bacterium]